MSFKKSVEAQSNDTDLELPNDDFTENDFQIAWEKFCNSERDKGNSNILSLLNMNQPSIKNNMIIIYTINKMNFKEMIEYKVKIKTFISKELNNYSLDIDVRLSKEPDKKTFLDSKEKLKIIQDSNNSISSLIDEFKLRI
ncbi:MAG: hypothetical protein ACJ0OM_00670 [Candidatus Marisimplicoccus sp.]